MLRRVLVLMLALAASWMLAGEAPAAIVFDFEGESTGTGLTSLTISQSGLTITITRPVDDTFGIRDLTAFSSPASWGARTLDPFVGGTQGTAFLVNFSTPVSSVSIETGDFGADNDSATTEIRAFDALDAGGNFLGLGSGSWGTGDIGGNDLPITLSVAAAGIRSVVFVGGSPDFPHSLYWDNLTVDGVVPGPPTLLTLTLGLGVAGASAWRLRRR